MDISSQIQSNSLQCCGEKSHCLKHKEKCVNSSMSRNISCCPLKVQQNSDVGRFLVAARDIRPLEVILEEVAFVVAPQSIPVCICCLGSIYPSRNELGNDSKASNVQKCGRCCMPVCSENCGDVHQNNSIYSDECDILSRLNEAHEARQQIENDPSKPSIIFATLGVLRLMLACERQTEAKPWINELMDHSVDLDADLVIKKHLEDIESLILDSSPEGLGLSSRFDKEMIRHGYGVLRVNSFGIETLSGGSGRALFPVTALISHSCQPNVLHNPKAIATISYENENDDIQNGMEERDQNGDSNTNRYSTGKNSVIGDIKMILRAQRQIKEGSEVCISYISIMQGRADRLEKLHEQWYFQCSCVRCNDESELGTWTSSITCPDCSTNDSEQSENIHLHPILSNYIHESSNGSNDTKSLSTNLQTILFKGKCGHSISNYKAKGIENEALMLWKAGFLNATSKVIAITFDGCSGEGDEEQKQTSREEKLVSYLDELEHLLKDIKKRLSSQHFLIIKMIMQLSLFTSKLALTLGKDSSGETHEPISEDDSIRKILRNLFNRHQAQCKSIIRYLSIIDPGHTPTLGQFMLEANKSKMALDKMDLDEGRISRIQFLSRLKDGVQVETSGRQMLKSKE